MLQCAVALSSLLVGQPALGAPADGSTADEMPGMGVQMPGMHREMPGNAARRLGQGSGSDGAWTITSGEAFCHVVADPENLGRSCITDGGDQYGNNENCGFTLNVASEVVAVGAFDLETCCDHLHGNGVDMEWSSGDRKEYGAQSVFTWQTDGSVTRDGWTLCTSQCPSGTHSDSGFEPGCSGTPCAPGSAGVTGSTTAQDATCASCQAGRYSDSSGAAACLSWPLHVCSSAEIKSNFGCCPNDLATCVDQASDGTVFYVGSGTFDWSSEVTVSDKHITIIGAGASDTVLDRHQGGRFFIIRETGSVTLIGVTVQNGQVGVVAMLLRSVRVM